MINNKISVFQNNNNNNNNNHINNKNKETMEERTCEFCFKECLYSIYLGAPLKCQADIKSLTFSL
jgi:hypothetical protein